MNGFSTNAFGEREYEGLRLYALVVGGFRDFRETHKQKDNTAFQDKSLKALLDKASSILTRLHKGLQEIFGI